jgi:hypothetical protein
MQNKTGFFAALFDLSFTSLVTTRIIKVLYVLAIVVIGLYALVFIAAAFNHSSTDGVLVLVIGAPIFALFSLIYTRVLLEVFIALFRIMENTGELVARAGAVESSAASSSGPQAPPSGQ